MNTTFRAGWLILALLSAPCLLPAQTSVSEDLARADKQFDLYAYNLALRTYESVLKTEPNNTRALARVADCYYQLNRPEEALPYYDRAATQAKDDPGVMLRYGKTLMQSGDYIGAKKWFLYYAEGNPAVGRNYADMCDYAMMASQKDGAYQVRNEPANTVAADYCAAFLGNRVVFNSARNDIDRKTTPKSSQDWTGSAYNQLFVTQRNATDGFLQKPEFLQSDLENNYNEGPVSFSADGRRVAFCKNNFIDGTRQIGEKGLNMSLYTADVVEGKWVNVKSFPYNGSDFATGFPSLSPDGKILYFAANQPNGLGGWDIYSCYWTAGGWSQPQNLGAPVNTTGNEVTPYFDGVNLFFSSDWHKGLGGQDVFRAEFTGDQITGIYHLGAGVNSPRDDYGFIYDESSNFGYVTSNRPQGRGNEDIWQVRKRMDTFTILVQNAANTPIASAEIDFSACGAGLIKTDNNGRYEFSVTAGQADCSFTVRKEGFVAAQATARSAGTKNIVITLAEQRDEPQAPVVYNSVAKSASPGIADNMYTLLVTDNELHPLNYVEVDLGGCDGGVFYTDETGKCKFLLSDDASCMLSLNLAGYESVLMPIQANASRQFIVAMTPINRGSAIPAARPQLEDLSPVVYNTTPEPQAPTKILSTKTVEPAKPALKQDDPASSGAKGYSIQLAAGPGALSDDRVKQYEKLSPHGNIYSKTEAKLTKVRLGVYPTKAEADAVLSKAKAIAKDAYVVNESGVDQRLLIGAEPELKPVEHNAALPAKAALPAVYFAVQVGSFSSQDPVSMSKYSGLADIGNVYMKPDNGITRVRIGVWANHADAEKAKQELVNRGFTDALIVTEKGGDPNIDALLQSGVETPTVPATKPAMKQPAETRVAGMSPKGVPSNSLPDINAPVVYNYPQPAVKPGITAFDNNTANPSTPGKYYVRVASMVNPAVFDVRKAESAGGKIEARKSEDSDLTVMLLGVFDNLEEAMLASNRVRVMGYSDAYVVKEVAGKLRKLQYMQ